MSTIAKLITLINTLAELVRAWRRTKEQKEHEQAHEQLQKDPPEWFKSHFGAGGPADAERLPDSAELPSDAADPRQANTGQRDDQQPRWDKP